MRKDYAKEFYDYVRDTQDYECLGRYTNSREKIKIRHSLCGYEWDIVPNSFKSKGTRCPKCNGNNKKTNSEFLKELNSSDDLKYYIPLEKYTNNKTKIKMKHKVCENIFEVTPDKILNEGTRCPYCSGRVGHDYKKECQDKLGDDYEVLTQSMRHIDKIKAYHIKCDTEYITTPNKILQGRKCPNCNKSSSLEQEVRNILKKNNITFKEQYTIGDCRKILPLRFDFALDVDSSLFLVECQGQQHYKDISIFDSLENNRERDLIKRNYCKLKNIPLIEIPYWDIKKSESIILNAIENNK